MSDTELFFLALSIFFFVLMKIYRHWWIESRKEAALAWRAFDRARKRYDDLWSKMGPPE